MPFLAYTIQAFSLLSALVRPQKVRRICVLLTTGLQKQHPVNCSMAANEVQSNKYALTQSFPLILWSRVVAIYLWDESDMGVLPFLLW